MEPTISTVKYVMRNRNSTHYLRADTDFKKTAYHEIISSNEHAGAEWKINDTKANGKKVHFKVVTDANVGSRITPKQTQESTGMNRCVMRKRNVWTFAARAARLISSKDDQRQWTYWNTDLRIKKENDKWPEKLWQIETRRKKPEQTKEKKYAAPRSRARLDSRNEESWHTGYTRKEAQEWYAPEAQDYTVWCKESTDEDILVIRAGSAGIHRLTQGKAQTRQRRLA